MYDDERTMTESDWDWQDAKERGSHRPDSYWVLTDRDVWHKNPEDERYEPVVQTVSVFSLLNDSQPLAIEEIDDVPF
jgi:hypothetical protein